MDLKLRFKKKKLVPAQNRPETYTLCDTNGESCGCSVGRQHILVMDGQAVPRAPSAGPNPRSAASRTQGGMGRRRPGLDSLERDGTTGRGMEQRHRMQINGVPCRLPTALCPEFPQVRDSQSVLSGQRPVRCGQNLSLMPAAPWMARTGSAGRR